MLSVTLTLGGVFALFGYAQSDAEPVSKNVNTQLEEFVYGDYPAGFTSGMKAVLDVAETDTTYGLNASGHDAGMRKALVLSTIVSARHGYGYVGTMDKTYCNDVYGKDAVENISVVITFANDIDGVQTIYICTLSRRARRNSPRWRKTVFWTTFFERRLSKTPQPQPTGICAGCRTVLPTW